MILLPTVILEQIPLSWKQGTEKGFGPRMMKKKQCIKFWSQSTDFSEGSCSISVSQTVWYPFVEEGGTACSRSQMGEWGYFLKLLHVFFSCFFFLKLVT